MPDAYDIDPVLRVDSPPWFQQAIVRPFEQRQVDVDGCAINYLLWRSGDERVVADDAGLVFVHGGGAHAHWWTHVAATFHPWVTSIAVDLSGHGDSGRRDDYSLEAWTDEVVAVAHDAGISRPIVIGHSMGGFVTIATAARHPEVVAGAVIVDSPVTIVDAEVRAAASATEFSAPRTYPDLAFALSRFRTIPEQAHYLDYVVDYVARRSLRQVGGGWQWKYDANFWHAMRDDPRASAVPYVSQITCRAALFRCEDGLVDIDISRFMFDRMGRAMPVIELPTSGHHPMLDTPLILITGLRTLLADWLHSDPHPRAS